MPRPLALPENITTRFPEGTNAAIERVLPMAWDRQDFIRFAVGLLLGHGKMGIEVMLSDRELTRRKGRK